MPDPHFLIAGVPVPDWRLAVAYAIPIGAALLLGLLVHYVLRRFARRVALKDSSRARVAHAVILPLAFALPLIFLGQALRAVPMPEEHLANWLHLLRLVHFIRQALYGRSGRVDHLCNLLHQCRLCWRRLATAL